MNKVAQHTNQFMLIDAAVACISSIFKMQYQSNKLWLGSLYHGTTAKQIRDCLSEEFGVDTYSIVDIHVRHVAVGHDSFAFVQFTSESVIIFNQQTRTSVTRIRQLNMQIVYVSILL